MAMTPVREGGCWRGACSQGLLEPCLLPRAAPRVWHGEDQAQAGKTAGIADESDGAAALERGARGDAAPVAARPARGRRPGPRRCHPRRTQKPSS
ncbi:hypothetical protein RLOC_00004299 [Lonchura striata]|uniref:Uncharacterized protein n=1 Tax=Lonchura striata TaxID=40157 RepID=A0A218V8W0_9PASE|nr:hypothetical protein RLOC_00004299 [Lonchura striata domestica]